MLMSILFMAFLSRNSYVSHSNNTTLGDVSLVTFLWCFFSYRSMKQMINEHIQSLGYHINIIYPLIKKYVYALNIYIRLDWALLTLINLWLVQAQSFLSIVLLICKINNYIIFKYYQICVLALSTKYNFQ